MSDITLTLAARTNLLSLQRTTRLIGRTQERLATGLKVNSAIDDALAFFKARNLNSRASDLMSIKDNITDGINIIKASIQGLESVESVLKQMKALGLSAISSPESSTRSKLASEFNELRSQVDNLMEDANFNGVNLLKNSVASFRPGSDTLTVKFNERTEPLAINQLVVSGLSTTDFTTIMARSALVTGTAGSTSVWGQTGVAAITAINRALRSIDSALVTVRLSAQTFGTRSSLLEIRRSFTENIVNTLKGGAADLVNADLNEESANLLSLQTRQQLGTVSLSIAQQSEQAILRLFG
ncbi:MAG: flagellin [Alphaproteobacteria bacterium]|nr:flagellin [Alphaproteobacteria bacterium]